MSHRLNEHDGLVLVLAAIGLMAVAAVVGPDISERYGPTRDGMIELSDSILRAKLAGALRLVALTAGVAVIGLGHARLEAGPGRSFFLTGGLTAMAFWWLAALLRLAFTEPDVVPDEMLAHWRFDALARLADTAALLPAGLAVAGFGLGRAEADDEAEPAGRPTYVWSLGYGLTGATIALCGLSLGVFLGESGVDVDTTIVRPGAGATIAGSVLVLLAALAIGERLAELARGPSTDARRDHRTMAYEFADWDDTRRQGLELRLRGAGIPHSWEGTDLVVARTAESAVDEIVEELEGDRDQRGR